MGRPSLRRALPAGAGAIGTALATVTEDGESFATLQLQMSYFQPVREGRLVATARLLRRGRSTAYLECEIHDGAGELVAKATSVVTMRRRKTARRRTGNPHGIG